MDALAALGPGAGRHGGETVAAGTPAQAEKSKASLTGRYPAIGRTPRSNPATYTKLFDLVRDFFAERGPLTSPRAGP